jgi:hypothetical protein
MDYASIRAQIKSGDLLAFSHRASMWASWYDFKVGIVRMFTKSEYSHVALAWVSSERVFVLEAVIPRVRIYPLSNALAESGEFYHLPLGVNWAQDVEDWAMQHVGQRYSQIKAMQASWRPVKHDDFTECAEYVNEVLSGAGVNLGRIATPTAIVLAAQRRGAPCSLITKETS